MANHHRSATQVDLSPTLTFDERRQKFIEVGWWSSIPANTIPSHWLFDGEHRLDAGYYTQEAIAALRLVQDGHFKSMPLNEIVADLFILGRFKRIYAQDKDAGWPYLSASEALQFRPVSNRYIARDHAPKNAQSHFVKQGWLLVSASGTVGRVIVTSKRLERYFLTHDLIRVVPKKFYPIGYLYAFLASWIGQALISKDKYGSAIKHLEPHHLASVPVPLLPDDEQKAIHDEIMRAYALREEANELLDEADALIHSELGLPRFDESLVPYLPAPTGSARGKAHLGIPHPKAFTVLASALNDRLDVSYHVPVVQTVIDLLLRGNYPLQRLDDLADNVHLPPRFKRIYVRKGYGVPFLRPSHLPQIRFYDLGYISHLTRVLDSLTLRNGDVLVTTDGTVGRISLVTSRIVGWAGSNNIARITYGNKDCRNGYLAAFLATPYGFHQLNREIYGGVVDHIDASHIMAVFVPKAPDDVQRKIGKLVVSAYEKKDEASIIEDVAIQRVEARLTGFEQTRT